jgi:hypothetical protein
MNDLTWTLFLRFLPTPSNRRCFISVKTGKRKGTWSVGLLGCGHWWYVRYVVEQACNRVDEWRNDGESPNRLSLALDETADASARELPHLALALVEAGTEHLLYHPQVKWKVAAALRACHVPFR